MLISQQCGLIQNRSFSRNCWYHVDWLSLYTSQVQINYRACIHIVTCLTASDLTSQLRWAILLPRVLWLWTSPPSWGRLWCCQVSYDSGPRLQAEVDTDAITCPMAPDITSRLGWTPVLPRVIWLWISPLGRGGLWCCHVSYGSGPHLPAEMGYGAATCPVGPYEPRASSIKKSLTCLPVQLGTHVPNAHMHVSKAPHVKTIMRL
jgi:hypothetical protein